MLERDPEKAAREFEESLTNKKSDIASKYLKPFSDVVDEIVDISIKDDEKSVELYLYIQNVRCSWKINIRYLKVIEPMK